MARRLPRSCARPATTASSSPACCTAKASLFRPTEAQQIHVVEPDAINVSLPSDIIAERWPTRSLLSSTACGVCGTTSRHHLRTRLTPTVGDFVLNTATVAALPQGMRAHQKVFAATGAVHAAALFSRSGELLCLREDVGRHNAVDKVVGWAVTGGWLPLDNHILCLSGRGSFELISKAAAASIPVVIAVSAPSSMAVDMAEAHRITLCGMVREGGFQRVQPRVSK